MDWLVERRDTLVELWFNRLMESYPEQASLLLKRQKDPFANPVGTTFRRDLATLFDFITGTAESAAFDKALDNICRIRSVQDFTPSQAIGFVFQLKEILREQMDNSSQQQALENVIDQLALRAFDAYQHCREELAQVRVNEAHRRTDALVRQLNSRNEAEQA